jgi:hypothetical protein
MEKLKHPDKIVRSTIISTLNTYGQRIYNDDNTVAAAARFRLTQTKLQDIISSCGAEPSVEACARHLVGIRNNIPDAIQLSEVSNFIKVAILGRRTMKKRGLKPSFFVRSDVLSLAKMISKYFSRIPENA